jgi:hypothetical protein
MNKKTYAERRSRKMINWNDVIENRINGTSDHYTTHDLAQYAGSWVTCACGNQCEIIPRNGDGSPQDEELSDLGIDFSTYIGAEEWRLAKVTLSRIEARSKVLIDYYEAREKGLPFMYPKQTKDEN